MVVAFGATEQHGHHMPLATDALLGDHFARRLADRLDAFVAPTVRVGCSSHHLAFPGTLSIADETFHAIVADLVSSLVQAGFTRIVLVPTHGGNFAPLAAAVEKLPDSHRRHVVALTDLSVFIQVAQLGEREFEVPMARGRPARRRMGDVHAAGDSSRPGPHGPRRGRLRRRSAGSHRGPVRERGRLAVANRRDRGSDAQASAEHGRRYWEAVLDLAVELVEAESSG